MNIHFIYLIILGICISQHVVHAQTWSEDHLGNGFEFRIVQHTSDYEGKVISTIIRKKASTNSKKAVLYVHGFNDYFFQTEYADTLINRGYHFYAVDLRKYGRSFLPNHKMNNVRDLREYYADIDSTLAQMKQDGMEWIVLNGHSTGGLIVSLYAADHQQNPTFNALLLNSPFFDMNLNWFMENVATPLGAFLGEFFPDNVLAGAPFALYGMSLHKNDYGEWNYNLDWKPHISPDPNMGWIRAIHLGHERVQAGLTLNQPILVMHAHQTIYADDWSDRLFTGDAVLDVQDIREYAQLIDGNVTIVSIKNGLHDLVLSKKSVRDQVYKKVIEWLNLQILEK
jgi:alpha-beta hydrolase superfamily lysophospholipase